MTYQRHHPATRLAWEWLNEQEVSATKYDRIAAILHDIDHEFIEWEAEIRARASQRSSLSAQKKTEVCLLAAVWAACWGVARGAS